jgi:hypothetical protein
MLESCLHGGDLLRDAIRRTDVAQSKTVYCMCLRESTYGDVLLQNSRIFVHRNECSSGKRSMLVQRRGTGLMLCQEHARTELVTANRNITHLQ